MTLRTLGVIAVLALTACTAAPAPTASPAQTGAATPTSAAARPILIDTDMAADDIIAIAVLLRDPAVEVKAITVEGTGEAHCAAGTRNVHRLLEAFGVPDIPVGCGREAPGPNGRLFPDEWRAGADSMYGLSLPQAANTASADATQLIADTAASAAASGVVLTIVAVGPWTNLADALNSHPSIAPQVAIHAMGGALEVDGNIDLGDTHFEHGVEWNLGVDPDADAAVIASAVPITLVPLDATNYVPVPPERTEELATDNAAAGAAIVHEMFVNLPYLTSGDWYIWDPLAALTVSQPDLVTWQEVLVALEVSGPQAGRLRLPADDDEFTGRRIVAAMSADADAVFDALFAALRRGAPPP